MRRKATLERVFHNQTGEPVYDDYGYVVPVGRSRVRTGECVCEVPCKAYRCGGCRQKRRHSEVLHSMPPCERYLNPNEDALGFVKACNLEMARRRSVGLS